MNDAPELLPCPFCGENKNLGYDATQDAIMCFDCLCAGPEHVSQGQAIAAWNRRAAPAADLAAAQAQIEALRGAWKAWKARNDAVDAYNAKLIEVKQRRSEGDWSGNMDPEHQAMEKAKRDFIEVAESLGSAVLPAKEG